MSYRDKYYEEVDNIFGTVKPNPMNDQPDGNSVVQESNQPLGPAGWVENADGTDGEPTVIINANGITVTDGAIAVSNAAGSTTIEGGIVKTAGIEADSITADKIQAGAITTAKLNASAVIKLVTNDGATVVINSAGITVTDGEISVTNGSGTVIIDGTSNMFKIAATGTQNITVASGAAGGSVSTTLTGLGALPTTPAHLVYLATGNTSSAQQHLGYWRYGTDRRFLAGVSGGATTFAVSAHYASGFGFTTLNGSSEAVVFVALDNEASGVSITLYERYYILKEAAL